MRGKSRAEKRGAGARGEGNLQSPVRASDGETAPGRAKIAVGRQCSSGRHIPGGQGLACFGEGSRLAEGCDRSGGRASDPLVPTE